MIKYKNEKPEKFCIDCGTKLSKMAYYYGYKRCKKCSSKQHSKRMSGENHTGYIFGITKKFLIKEYVQNKKSINRIAKEVGCSESVIRNRLLKYNICIRTMSEACKLRQKHFGRYHTEETKEKIRNSDYHKNLGGENHPLFGKRGKEAPMFGKRSPNKHNRYKKDYYKGIWMRSSWEIKYAKYLDRLGIKWQYESKRFDLGKVTYLPDFYLPEKNVYVEIKGYMSEKAYLKIKKFLKQCPDIKLQILMKEELKKLGVLK